MSFAARINPSLSLLVIPLLKKKTEEILTFLCDCGVSPWLSQQPLNTRRELFPIFMIRLRFLTRRLDPLLQFRRHASTKASHTDITSFLTHASSTKLSPKSTYYV